MGGNYGNNTMLQAITYLWWFYSNFTKPEFTFSIPTIPPGPPGYKNWDVPSEPAAQNPIKDSVYTLVLHIILFVIVYLKILLLSLFCTAI